MDFYTIKEREGKKGVLEVYPDFKVTRSEDLMIRGRAFYCVWDDLKGMWSTDEFDVQRLVDQEIYAYEPKDLSKYLETHKKFLGNWSSSTWLQFRNYMAHLPDNSHQLDETLTFANTEVTKGDFVSRRLPYNLEAGDYSAWDELVAELYNEEERAKIEWAIGAIVSGDSKTIQKFLVFYGPGGAGKSTIMNIIVKLFTDYVAFFEAKQLASSNNQFATEPFRFNPLVAIQQDGDLSKIEDNTKLNSIISHEKMTFNEKFKSSYEAVVNAMLIIGSNKAVKITDAKSGIIRRLIDIHPSGRLISPRKYQALNTQIDFELGAIAHHCLQVYREMGKEYYSTYRPVEMMLQTDIFYNFIESYFDVFSGQDGITLAQAYKLYKEWCTESNVEHTLALFKFREEFRNYFKKFEERAIVDGLRVRSWYSGFVADKFKMQVKDDMVFSLVMDETDSLLDHRYDSYPAQYSNKDGNPIKKWTVTEEETKKGLTPVTTTLSDLNTRKEHYVNVPEHEIVIDFDLEDDEGNKSVERNLEAASQWPPTYSEFSRSEHGIHLHYLYEGDVAKLKREYEPGIEVKVYSGSQALRRKLSKCNNVPVATLKEGQLPLREEPKKMIDEKKIKSEKSLRDLIERNIRKEIHPGTKSSVDFIYQILEDAYNDGLAYDVTDLRSMILAFALNSSHQAETAVKVVQKMKFASADALTDIEEEYAASDSRIAFFDVEVFPNLFILCWKFMGGDKVTMINPTATQVEEVMKLKLIGFNNRRYDNHILYGASLGYSIARLYLLSQSLIDNKVGAGFREAYNISYADIYDFTTLKQSLKQYEIDLDLHHQELGLPWDQPVPEKLWSKVAEYCGNDVDATEETFKSREADFIARQILSDLSGLPVNAMTNTHSAKIIFGDDRSPQSKFNYTKLDTMFPGYKFELGKSFYKGIETGEGGYVYSEPGMYTNVAVLDIASMHPTSIEELDLFGPYTKKFSEIKTARVAIKRKDFETTKQLLGGILEKYLGDPSKTKALSDALKIVINSVYGLTSAKFDNVFKDPRNIDNIVAKRGALFMVDLQLAVQAMGWKAIHIKTDSIKIPDSTPEKIQFVMDFGKRYGYDFEHEHTYEKMCLMNDAVFVAKIGWAQDEKEIGTWSATGAQFIHPYVFKHMFSKDKITFKDKCEAKAVQTALYLDFTDMTEPMVDTTMKPLHFVGKVGNFCPMKPGTGGGILVRQDKTDPEKFHSANGAKGWLWLESEMVKFKGKEKDIDMSYFEKLVDTAREDISKFGDYEWFVS